MVLGKVHNPRIMSEQARESRKKFPITRNDLRINYNMLKRG